MGTTVGGRGHALAAPLPGRRVDRIGAVLLVVFAVWGLVTAIGRPESRPWPIVVLSAAVLVALATGRWGSRLSASGVPAVVAVGVAGAIALALPEIVRAGGSPTGYANANADLAALGALAAIAVIPRVRDRWWRRAAAGLSILLALAVAATGSVAALVLLAAAALLALTSSLRAQPIAAVAGGAVLVTFLLGITTAISHGSEVGDLADRVGERADLWNAAAEQAAANPLRGQGPGTYQATAAVSSDLDLRWAHHEYLQTAAEEGLIGLALLLVLLGCAYVRLLLAPTHSRAILGATAVTLVAAHASLDHVLHHAAVPITLAVLVGWATAAPPSLGSRGSHRPRP